MSDTTTNGRRRSKPAGKKDNTPSPSRPTGNQWSAETTRRAAVILEVLAGARTPGEAAQALSISVNYYYVLERKALQGLVSACAPSAKGPPGPSAEKRLEKLQQELARWQRECQRQAALVRATQRAVGLPASPAADGGAPRKKRGVKRKRSRKPSVRALRAAEALRKNSSSPNPPESIEQLVREDDSAAQDSARPTRQEGGHDATGQETAGRTAR